MPRHREADKIAATAAQRVFLFVALATIGALVGVLPGLLLAVGLTRLTSNHGLWGPSRPETLLILTVYPSGLAAA